MSSQDSKKRKKKHPKQYYMSNKRKKFTRNLDKDMKGFLFTVNPRQQKNVVGDSYKILNEFGDALYGRENKDEEANFDPDEDFTDQLNKQLEGIKDKETQQRRFQHVDTNVKCYHFIQTQIEDPGLLMKNFLSNIEATGKSRSKNIERMLPVNTTCKAQINHIVKAIEPVLEQYFGNTDQEAKSYYIIFNKRNNNKDEEMKPIYQHIISLMQARYSRHRADFKNPDLVIYIQVLCNVCCISILEEYNRFRKYNIKELASAYWKKVRSSDNSADNEATVSTGTEGVKKETQEVKEVQAEKDSEDPNELDVGPSDNEKQEVASTETGDVKTE